MLKLRCGFFFTTYTENTFKNTTYICRKIKIMKQDVEIYKAVDWALKHDQDTGLIDVLKELNRFGHEPGITKFDLLEEIQKAIEQIECYVPERNELRFITDLCKYLKS